MQSIYTYAARAHRGCSQKLRSYREVRNTRRNEAYQSEWLDRHRLRVRALIRELHAEYRWTGNRWVRACASYGLRHTQRSLCHRETSACSRWRWFNRRRGRRKRGEKERTKLNLRFFFVRETRQFDPFRANQFIELFRGR